MTMFPYEHTTIRLSHRPYTLPPTHAALIAILIAPNSNVNKIKTAVIGPCGGIIIVTRSDNTLPHCRRQKQRFLLKIKELLMAESPTDRCPAPPNHQVLTMWCSITGSRDTRRVCAGFQPPAITNISDPHRHRRRRSIHVQSP